MASVDDYLDGIDNGAETAEVEQEQEATQETGVEETQVAAETTKEEPAKVKDPIKGLEAAAAADRRKRQQAEAEAAELRAQLAEQQKEKPDFWEDPEARLAETKAEFEQRLIAQKLDISEFLVRERYSDYDEKFEVFAELVKENPALYHQMLQQVNPADFAYKTALSTQKLKEMGDPLKYEAQLKEKIRAELKAEMDAENKKKAALPGTLATTAGSGGSTGASWNGPTSLDDLLK